MDCTSCEELREIAPEFVAKGLTDEGAENLASNLGYGGKSTDCNDLNLANDCLIGRMPNALRSYDDCDWKAWAKDFSNNVYQVMGSVIAAICGLWRFAAKSFINYIRDYGSGGHAYFQSFNDGDTHTQDYYMDARHTSYGSKVADRDYIVLISHCFNVQDVTEFDSVVTWYSSGDTRSISEIRNETGQHPTMLPHDTTMPMNDMSWTITTAILVKKGEHVKSNIYCIKSSAFSGGTPVARIHQIAMTWIPASISSEE